MIAKDSHAVFLTATRTCLRGVSDLLTKCCDHSDLRVVIVCGTSRAFFLPFSPQLLLVFRLHDHAQTVRVARMIHNLSTDSSRCVGSVSHERSRRRREQSSLRTQRSSSLGLFRTHRVGRVRRATCCTTTTPTRMRRALALSVPRPSRIIQTQSRSSIDEHQP